SPANLLRGIGCGPGAGSFAVFRRTTIVALTSSFGSATPIILESTGALRSLPRTATLSVGIHSSRWVPSRKPRLRYHAHARTQPGKTTSNYRECEPAHRRAAP